MPRYATSRQKACKPCMVAKTKCDKKPGRCARCNLRGLQCVYAKQNGFPVDAKNGHSVGKDVPATSYGGPEVLGPSSTDESQPKPYAEPSTASITAHTAAPAPTTHETPQVSHPSTRGSHRDSNAESSSALKTPPTAKPTPTNDLYCPIDADAIQNRWLKFYLSEPGQNQKHYTANVTTFISRMLNSYVSILIRGTGIPPFLHKSHISTTSASMPALSICLTLLHTCHSPQPHDSPSLVTTIQSEMLRLSAEHLTHPDAPLFAAFQAHLIYCMLLFFHFPALSKPFRRQAMMDLQTLACASSRGGLVCVADKTGTVPEWESWVLAEAKRRTLYTMYLFDSLLSAEEGTPTLLGTELKGLPAPAGRGVWGAGTRGEWEVAFVQWSAEGEEILKIEELWPLPVETEREEMEAREARVQRWLEDVDEFGTMFLSAFEVKRQGATGDGLVVNVLEAYNFVVNKYSPGDKIYRFGFSRGAFTARAIAGMITDLGVINPDSIPFFSHLFDAYQKNTGKHTFRKTKEYFEWKMGKAPFVPESQKETGPYPKIPWYDTGSYLQEYENSRSIELVGVFDTVGSLGMADSYVHSHASSRQVYEWLNVKWNPYIKHAFHALALDDRRQPFLPTLYYIPNEKTIAAEKESLAKDEVDWPELTEHRQRIDEELEQQRAACKPDLVQVWFTGVHINVGGGTDKAETDFEGLANIAFAWMVEQCRPYLAFDEYTNASLARYFDRMIEDATEQRQRAEAEPAPSMVGKTVATITQPLFATTKWLGSWVSSPPPPPKEKMVRTYCFSAEKSPKYEDEPRDWTLFRMQDNYTRMYQLMGPPADRTPGACDDRSTELHTPLHELGETEEWMHPSVRWRQLQSGGREDDKKYQSKPLDALQCVQKDGVWGWTQKDEVFQRLGRKHTVWVPEWPIKAALDKKKDPSVYDANENAELALLELCTDADHVRDFLRDRAEPYKTANASARKKANASAK